MKTFNDELAQHIAVMQCAAQCSDVVQEAAKLLIETFERGHKVLLCGNCGSASYAQHIAAEFVLRY